MAPAENLRTWTPDEIRSGLFSALVELLPQYGYHKVDPLLVLSEAQHETGNFTSDLLLRADNAFGMKFPHQRQTTAIDEDNGYAVYNTLADSAEDYVMRQRNFGIPDTDDPAAYIHATVDSGYAGDPNYADLWAAAYAKNMGLDLDTDPQQAGTEGGILLMALAGAAILTAMEKRHD